MDGVGQARPTRSFPRSAASVYWVRSFVPIEKKSASVGERSTPSSAAAGHLDHDADLDRGGRAAGRRATSRSSVQRAAGAPRSSRPSGTSRERGWSAATRSIARSWVRRSSGRARPSRIPRTPRNGFGSRRLVRGTAIGLSAPGVERADQQRPALQCLRRPRDRPLLLVARPAAWRRSMNRNSVRNRPMPSAPAATAAATSSGRADVGCHLDRRSRRSVTRRLARGGAGLSDGRRARRAPRSASSRAMVSGCRVDVHLPRPPSTATVTRPRSTASARAPTPTTAGIPSERASTAACDVGPPRAVDDPERESLGPVRRCRRA